MRQVPVTPDVPATYRSVRELPVAERAREKLQLLGPSSLTNAEMLALILDTGTRTEPVLQLAERILREHDGFAGLMKMDVADLSRIHGIGPAQASKLRAVMEIARRVIALGVSDRPKITTPEDVFNLVELEMSVLEQEQLRVVLLNTKNEVISLKVLYQGSVNQAQVRMGELFRDAVRTNATGIVIVHNHPSGDPTPSSADVQLTRDAVTAGNCLDIGVVDHLIVGRGRNASLRRLKLGFE